MSSPKKKYVVLDKITDQFLSSFVDSVGSWIERDSYHEDAVTPDDFHKSALFDSVESARRAVEILNHQFKDEEGIDFVVMEATEKRVVSYSFHEVI
jgi:hypothetical protein